MSVSAGVLSTAPESSPIDSVAPSDARNSAPEAATSPPAVPLAAVCTTVRMPSSMFQRHSESPLSRATIDPSARNPAEATAQSVVPR